MDFDTEMHLVFPEKTIYDSSEVSWSNKLSDKTKRDMYFYRSNEDEYNYGDMKWK